MEEFNLQNQNTIDDDMVHLVHFSGEESEFRERAEHKGSMNSQLDFEIEEKGGNICTSGIASGLSAENILSCEENYERREENHCNFEEMKEIIHFIETDEYKYIGEVKNELREGFGICYSKNGEVYKGQWKNDRRNGFGMVIYPDDEIIRGEVVDDNFQGFCEKINYVKKVSMEGYYQNNGFIDYVVVKHESKIFEGEVIRDLSTNCSLGKVTSLKNNKNSKKFFSGEILNYKEENGFGIYVSTHSSKDTSTTNPATNVSTMYQGCTKKKIFEDYLEMYNSDGAAYFCFLRNGQKHGICFSFSKDGKVSFGVYDKNCKQGPFLSFSNCHNLPKSSVRMELFYLDFKSKVVDKMETSKKYLLQNYPEFTYIFNINYSEIIAKLSETITEELTYLNHLNSAEENISL